LVLILFLTSGIAITNINPTNKKGITIFTGKVLGFSEVFFWLLSVVE